MSHSFFPLQSHSRATLSAAADAAFIPPVSPQTEIDSGKLDKETFGVAGRKTEKKKKSPANIQSISGMKINISSACCTTGSNDLSCCISPPPIGIARRRTLPKTLLGCCCCCCCATKFKAGIVWVSPKTFCILTAFHSGTRPEHRGPAATRQMTVERKKKKKTPTKTNQTNLVIEVLQEFDMRGKKKRHFQQSRLTRTDNCCAKVDN